MMVIDGLEYWCIEALYLTYFLTAPVLTWKLHGDRSVDVQWIS